MMQGRGRQVLNESLSIRNYVLFRMEPPRGVGSPALGQGSVRRSMTMRGRAPKSSKTRLVGLATRRLQLHAFSEAATTVFKGAAAKAMT